MYGDGKEAEGKNFLYYSQDKFISIYMIFLEIHQDKLPMLVW